MHQTGFWKPIRRIQQRFCKNKGEFCVCMRCLMLRSRQKCSVLLLPGFIFHTSLQVSPGNACVKGNRQHSVLVISQRLLWHHGTQCPIIPPFSDSRFLRALIWAMWSVFVEVRSRISGESKVWKRQWVMCPVVLRPLSASLPFLDPSRVSKEFVGSSF